MSQPLPVLFFDKQGGFAYAKLKLFMKAALRGERYELVRIEEPAGAQAIAKSAGALALFSAMGSAARGKFKETQASGKQAHVREKAAWKALGAFAPLQQQDKQSEEESPGCVGTFWKSTQGAWICGMRHPLSTDFSNRGLTARWLRATAMLGRGELQLAEPKIDLHAPLSRLRGSSFCAYDLETEGFTRVISLFGFADEQGACCWEWNAETRAAVTEWMQSDRPKFGQNAIKFDAPILQEVCGVKMRGPLGDLMALQSVYVRQYRYSLQSIVSHFIPIFPWKAAWKAGESSEILYCAKDAGFTYLAGVHLHKRLGIADAVGLNGLALL